MLKKVAVLFVGFLLIICLSWVSVERVGARNRLVVSPLNALQVGGYVARQPIGVDQTSQWFPNSDENPSIFSKTAEAGEIVRLGDVITYTLTVRNNLGTAEVVQISDPLPPNVSLVPSSLPVGLSYDSVSRTVTGSPIVEPSMIAEAESLFGYQTLSGSLEPQFCPEECDDDEYITVAGLDFQFLGVQQDRVFVNPNGFVTVLPPEDGILEQNPQSMPDVGAPNGVIAPLWADFNLFGDPKIDADGGGEIYVGLVSVGGGDERTWTVIEWKDVELWGRPNQTYSFQLWIENGSSNLWFVYGELGGMNLADMGAGAEGAEAVFGFNTFMRSGGNVVGDVPSDFDSVKLSYNAGVAYQFAVTVDSGNLVTNSAEMILNSVVYEATAETNVYNNDLFLPLLNK